MNSIERIKSNNHPDDFFPERKKLTLNNKKESIYEISISFMKVLTKNSYIYISNPTFFIYIIKRIKTIYKYVHGRYSKTLPSILLHNKYKLYFIFIIHKNGKKPNKSRFN